MKKQNGKLPSRKQFLRVGLGAIGATLVPLACSSQAGGGNTDGGLGGNEGPGGFGGQTGVSDAGETDTSRTGGSTGTTDARAVPIDGANDTGGAPGTGPIR